MTRKNVNTVTTFNYLFSLNLDRDIYFLALDRINKSYVFIVPNVKLEKKMIAYDIDQMLQ